MLKRGWRHSFRNIPQIGLNHHYILTWFHFSRVIILAFNVQRVYRTTCSEV